MGDKRKVSFVVPCYNEEEAIPIYYDTMEAKLGEGILKDLEYEYVFVDDGSRDKSLEIMQKLRERDERVHYVSFSRNFGKEAALLAGLQNASGNYVVTMDVDLQDSPELLEEMYHAVVAEGYDQAAARRISRKGEGKIRSFLSEMFYKVINRLSDIEIASGARDYRFMKRSVVNAILSMSEYNRFSKGIFSWVGFKTKWIEYENVERSAGATKWSIWKLFAYAMEGIVAFSTKLLNLASSLGIICCVLAFFSLIFIVVRALLYGDPVAGWPSMMCVIILMGGLQLLCTGILGTYLSKIYLETKNRPVYIVREKDGEEI
ncbi:MAG: glycosyltransferase family 2 protein [Roseburia sp.]|nr:glycosyltransferase family 2 protein [Roseburia sp.]MCM1278132.1 glycosyltransferase family 2 protein [Robinsoniella sp.]